MKWISNLVLGCGVALGLAVGGSASALETVPRVDLNAYLGHWYEVFRLPNDFQDNMKDGFGTCFNTTAEYSLLNGGRIRVVNTCHRANEDHKVISEKAQGKARIVDEETNAKLKVNFTGNPVLEKLGIGDGDYWILHLGPLNKDGLYSYSLVGEPKFKHLWLLSRTNRTEESVIEEAKAKAKELGFDISKIRFSR